MTSGVTMLGEKRGEALLGQPVEMLVLPQGVVGIETDCGEAGHGILGTEDRMMLTIGPDLAMGLERQLCSAATARYIAPAGRFLA